MYEEEKRNETEERGGCWLHRLVRAKHQQVAACRTAGAATSEMG